jgi:2',3'-cyclic-nucleotide 2'-phosphodiesterase (5'-nucleotidase family)
MIRLLLPLLLALPAAAAEPIRLRVYHTNDIHGWIMPRPDRLQPERQVGGAAALAALLAKEKGPKLVLDAGDWWQGTPEGSLSKGRAVVEVFNAIGYDAVVIGNHEYDAGADELRALIPTIAAPVLSANTYGADGKLVPWVKPWIVKEVAGVKVGIFGLTTTGMKRLAFPKHIAGLTFRREADAAREAVKALKKAGATVIVAVTHVGLEQEGRPPFEGDQTVAREVEGIDLIVGGHSHTFLERPIRDPKNSTLITQAGHYLFKAGRVELEIDPKTKRVTKSSGELLELAPARQGEDPAVKDIVARHAAEVGKAFDVVIATAAEFLGREHDRENALGSWMTDCYREKTGARAALQNGGGIRAEMPAGPVTVRTIFNIMPFDNYLIALTMKGPDFQAAVDHGVGMARIAQLSGVEAKVRRGKPAGERLAALSVGGAPLDPAASYTLATLDFIVNGGDGYSVFSRADSFEATGLLARDALLACARAQGLIKAPATGRIVFTEE